MYAEDLPFCALADDRLVEVQGEAGSVHKAVELIVSHLRKFLVDRSVLPLFEADVMFCIFCVLTFLVCFACW
jgi:hypothetical protein